MTVEHQPRIFGIVPVGRAKELACGQHFFAADGSSSTAQEWQVLSGNTIRKVCEHELKARTGSGVVEAIGIEMLTEEGISKHGLRLVSAGPKNGMVILNGSNLVPDMVRWRKTA